MTILDVSCRWSTRHQNEDLVADHHHFHKKRSCDPLVADQHFHQVEQQGNGSNGAVFQQSEETKDSDGLPHPKVGGQSFQGMRWNIDAEMCRFIYFQVSYDDDKFQISLDAKNYKWEKMRVRKKYIGWPISFQSWGAWCQSWGFNHCNNCKTGGQIKNKSTRLSHKCHLPHSIYI